MTEQEQGAITVKLEGITQVLDLLDTRVTTNPTSGVITAINAVVESIYEIVAIKPEGES